MTTVDFRAQRIDADGPSIEIGNGLSGPATSAFHGLRELILRGEVQGYADEGTASATDVPGVVLRELLRGLGSNRGAIAVSRSGHHDEETLQAAIADDGRYSVSAIEV